MPEQEDREDVLLGTFRKAGGSVVCREVHRKDSELRSLRGFPGFRVDYFLGIENSPTEDILYQRPY